jgi:hypothetical protein
MSTLADRSNHRYEELLRDGISAAKTGQKYVAHRLLNRAILMNPLDARPYLWLSDTTEDLDEQRSYLEKAVVIDPSNVAARRGLAVLNGKIDRERLLAEGDHVPPRQLSDPEEVEAQAFLCSQCGGRMAFQIQRGMLTCEYCGHEELVDSDPSGGPIADLAETVLEFVMPTSSGHRWAESQQRLTCELCGAVTIMPPEEKTASCPFCGSNQMIVFTEAAEIIDPQVIAIMKVDRQQAAVQVRQWLGSGWFIPDDLVDTIQHLSLLPGYYSCWTYDGTIEVRWNCEVNEGSGKYDRWVPRSGVETRFFDDVLVPGVHSIPPRDLDNVGPFDLKAVQSFEPEYVAGWPTLIYNRSLSDASLLARETVTRRIRNQLYHLIEPGREKRNLRTGTGSWSGMTFKHILLPMWVGNYRYRNKPYRLLVNGQTGKVAGDKPSDRVKVVLGWVILAMVAALLVWLAGWLWQTYGASIF